MHKLLYLYFIALLIGGCGSEENGYSAYAVSNKVEGVSDYPIAVNMDFVGKYPAYVDSGAGYFYDEVLEYRVWMHPEKGAPDHYDGNDYYAAFAQFELAWNYSKFQAGAEDPLVLIRQIEWVNESKPGIYEHMKAERITEWQVRWLKDSKRDSKSIDKFLNSPRAIRY